MATRAPLCTLLIAVSACLPDVPVLPGDAGGQAGGGAVGGGGGGNTHIGGGNGNTGGGMGGDAGTPNPDAGSGSPEVRWLGRVERTAQGARFGWPGTGFVVRLQGTGLTARIKTTTEDYFQVVVDGQATLLTTQSGEHVYTLARGLAAGEHVLTLWRRTETVLGVVEVSGITVTQGTLLAPPAASTRLLEVVGDSITVGFGVGCAADDSFSYATEDNYQTYQAIAARALGADVVTVAWTGIGMWRDDDGQTDEQMPERYRRTIADEAASVWSFTSQIPAAVVVALGTNDFAGGDPGQPFVTAYGKFLDDLRGRYPQARLYLSLSPMVSDTTFRNDLNQLKSARNARGDTNVAILEVQPPADDGWACGHPNGATHRLMAATLERALKSDLGW